MNSNQSTAASHAADGDSTHLTDTAASATRTAASATRTAAYESAAEVDSTAARSLLTDGLVSSTGSTTSVDGFGDLGSTDRSIERTFDPTKREETTSCTPQAETTRSLTRRTTGPVSPAARRRGPGSIGVVMPTLLPSRPTFTGRDTYDLGTLTHVLIGAHARFAEPTRGPSTEALLHSVATIARSMIDANPNATRVLVTEASCLALHYLTQWRPAWPWTLAEAEYDTGTGRVDLAWVNASNGLVLFDEVKTTRMVGAHAPSPSWVEQAHRYAMAGHRQQGARFVGCRLIDLSNKRGWLLRYGEPRLSLTPETPISAPARVLPSRPAPTTRGAGEHPQGSARTASTSHSAVEFVPWDPTTTDPKPATPAPVTTVQFVPARRSAGARPAIEPQS